MQSLQQYQATFTAHLRNPVQQKKPQGINARRMGVYREIVFNNFSASISACFPVLLSILGKRRFGKLARLCFFSHQFESPLFSDIPKAFVTFLQSLDLTENQLPPFTAQLAHYEWAELYVSRLPGEICSQASAPRIEHPNALASLILQLQPAHLLVSYDYPVHQLSRKHPDLAGSATYLLLFRTTQFNIQFIQLNAVTYQLLQYIQSKPAPASSHLMHLARTLAPKLPANSIEDFGLQALHTLYLQQALIIDHLHPNQR